uniref:Uncharacterized protein n=1 Tax=Arundo donax TaxID=35708 RepID=A0A0A9B714_ARUDO
MLQLESFQLKKILKLKTIGELVIPTQVSSQQAGKLAVDLMGMKCEQYMRSLSRLIGDANLSSAMST